MHRPPRVPRTNGNVIYRGYVAWRHPHFTKWTVPIGLLLLSWILPVPATGALSSPKSSHVPFERQASKRYQAGEYDGVLQLLQSLPADEEPSRELVRYAVMSLLKLGNLRKLGNCTLDTS